MGIAGIEPTIQALEARVLTIILYPQKFLEPYLILVLLI